MGDIFRAYEMLSRSLDFEVAGPEMVAAEVTFKQMLAREMDFPSEMLEDPDQFSADWEVKAYLVPRKGGLDKRLDQTPPERGEPPFETGQPPFEIGDWRHDEVEGPETRSDE